MKKIIGNLAIFIVIAIVGVELAEWAFNFTTDFTYFVVALIVMMASSFSDYCVPLDDKKGECGEDCKQ